MYDVAVHFCTTKKTTKLFLLVLKHETNKQNNYRPFHDKLQSCIHPGHL